ncbi:putative AAA+ superfamily ATPase [Arcanobacterium wilhelmae]|uniref:AAA+ superfamily ATPase n=2 Tax=Arcanobacterium wilhelmae TaxID=1803177 RepID=A0ABT9NAU5_9ACTO|nr:ATP-binding protein [Arcanobacterium wilhelmae]MDP9800847.1 putative AAA+ superfamily ATPase [Arcanobacterium wilhelmae]WFN90219.1 ATP-binding protein [Arcanobacterium wilhelmae]
MFYLENEVKRHAEPLLNEMLSESPIVVLEGARQVGKSTLARSVASEREALELTLDNPEVADFAAHDPLGFLRQAGERLLVVDEAQREPSLVLAMKQLVDEDRTPGRFLVTGSADFLKTRGASDSLAGRAEILSLEPLSIGELHERDTPEDWVNWVVNGAPGDLESFTPERTREAILAGGYPVPLQRQTIRARNRWFESYVREVSSRDAAELSAGEFVVALGRMLKMLGSSGQTEMVYSKFARQVGVSEGSARRYLGLAEQMYLISELPAWGLGLNSRAVRKPKMALLDTGLAAYFSGMTAEKTRMVGGQEYFRALAEQFVVAELRKQRTWSEERFNLFHYRNRNDEIDIVIELFDGRLVVVEVKAGLSVQPKAWHTISTLIPDDRVAARVIVYLGEQFQRRSNNTYLMPISSLWTHPAL